MPGKRIKGNLQALNLGSISVNKPTLNDLPPEALEIILGKLQETDMLNCRLVCFYWKTTMERVLEQKVLSVTTKWNIKAYEVQERLIPTLCMKQNRQNSEAVPELEVFCPSNILKHPDNPFPANALKLEMYIYHKCITKKCATNPIKIDQLFKPFGNNLSCLILHGYIGSPQKFCSILSQVPNLKTLTLACLHLRIIGEETFDINTCKLPDLKQLTHLRLVPSEKTCGGWLQARQYFLWILEKYAGQLVGLSVEGGTLATSDKLENLAGKITFGNLRQLKISPINKDVLKLTHAAKLTHIMAGFDFRNGKIEELLNLIDNYSQTLTYLRIPGHIGKFEGQSNIGAKYESLKKLDIIHPWNEDETEIMKTKILPRFVAVEKLEFLCFTRANYNPAIPINITEYLNVCPKLERISLYNELIPRRNFTGRNDGTARVIYLSLV